MRPHDTDRLEMQRRTELSGLRRPIVSDSAADTAPGGHGTALQSDFEKEIVRARRAGPRRPEHNDRVPWLFCWKEGVFMPGTRQPTDLIVAKGRKHLSRAEEAARRAGELNVPPAKTAKPPKWLPEDLKKDYRAIGKQLIAAGLLTDLDADTLGRYLVSHSQWLQAAQRAQIYLERGDTKSADDWGRIQERYFKAARACAADLGLTVTSRCKLVLPPAAADNEDQNPFLQLIQGGKRA